LLMLMKQLQERTLLLEKKAKLISTFSWRKKLENKSKKRKIETYFTPILRRFPVTKRNDSNTAGGHRDICSLSM